MYEYFNTLNDIVNSLEKINSSLNKVNWIEIIITIFGSFAISIFTIFLTLKYERSNEKLRKQENINSIFLSSLHETLSDIRVILFVNPINVESNFISFCRQFGLNHLEEIHPSKITNDNILQNPSSQRYLKFISKNLGSYVNDLSHYHRLDLLLDDMDDSSFLFSDLNSLINQISVFDKDVLNLTFLLHDALANAGLSTYPEHIMDKLDKNRDINQFIKEYKRIFNNERDFKELYDKLSRQSKVDLYREI